MSSRRRLVYALWPIAAAAFRTRAATLAFLGQRMNRLASRTRELALATQLPAALDDHGLSCAECVWALARHTLSWVHRFSPCSYGHMVAPSVIQAAYFRFLLFVLPLCFRFRHGSSDKELCEPVNTTVRKASPSMRDDRDRPERSVALCSVVFCFMFSILIIVGQSHRASFSACASGGARSTQKESTGPASACPLEVM